ncbi:MAG: M48 family metallopeptidase [Deltaproteobacteria bacterium]|nr:M48 family metallopeptidase [Deltaproteobacteria bacterium]
MSRSFLASAGLLCLLVTSACHKVPYSGRNQFNLVPDSLMLPLGASSYTSTLASLTVVRKGENHEQVVQIGRRVARASGADYDWEFAFVKDTETINAWCLPGGKIAVYSGLLPVARNESGLAFILGHEIGHATAHHGAERLSQQLAVLGGLAGLNLYLKDRSSLSGEQRNLLLSALGLGAEVGLMLPFSRTHEREADIIGMMYMAKAGYPPGESIDIWDRMERASGGASVPAFLSTHPSYDTRKENLRDWMGRARKRYQRNKLDKDTTSAIWS